MKSVALVTSRFFRFPVVRNVDSVMVRRMIRIASVLSPRFRI